MSGESESEEWWFDVRPKGVGWKLPRRIDALFSDASDGQMVRSVRDACSCVTVTPSVQVQSPQKQSLDGGDPNVRVST